MAANFVRTKARHQANDQPACHGDKNHPMTQRASGRSDRSSAETMVVKEVGREGDTTQQQDGQERCAKPNTYGDSGE
jgi:hypothetical protein